MYSSKWKPTEFFQKHVCDFIILKFLCKVIMKLKWREIHNMATLVPPSKLIFTLSVQTPFQSIYCGRRMDTVYTVSKRLHPPYSNTHTHTAAVVETASPGISTCLETKLRWRNSPKSLILQVRGRRNTHKGSRSVCNVQKLHHW